MRRRIAGWVWLRGCGARDAYDIGNFVATLTPTVFTAQFGQYGMFVKVAAETRDSPRLDQIQVECAALTRMVNERLPNAEVEINDEEFAE